MAVGLSNHELTNDGGGTSSPAKLWTANFILLWQGNLVSSVGDVLYEIALGFWILAVTGSTALMGALMAASTIPRVLFAPIAGVVVDRTDRKWLLVLMDAIRGIVVVLVAVAAMTGYARVWMVFVAGVIIGLCAAFFNPAVMSVIPDIVTREKIVQANSFFSMIRAGSGIIGNSLGGVLYAAIGAPIMFLINGVSYLFSAGTETFLNIPAVHKGRETPRFFRDMKDGFRYVWTNTGMRFLMLAAGVLNFFAMIGLVLIIPLFHQTDWLGPSRYGVLMAVLTASMVLGMATTAAVTIPAHRRMLIFGISTVTFVTPFIVLPFFNVLWPMLLCVAIGGYSNAIVNVLIQSILQLAVPERHRGKVFGLIETLTGGLTPIGMAAGGILGEVLPLEWVIGGAFALIGLYVFPQLGSRGVRVFFAVEEALADEGGERSENKQN